MKLSQLLEGIEYTLIQGNIEIEISDIIYDSRKVEKGTAFVCLKGYNVDGHKFAADAVAKGASALIVSDSVEAPEDVAVVKVGDTREALAYLSANLFDNPAEELTTIAITGTKGKTTTVAMIKRILECAGLKAEQSAHSVS